MNKKNLSRITAVCVLAVFAVLVQSCLTVEEKEARKKVDDLVAINLAHFTLPPQEGETIIATYNRISCYEVKTGELSSKIEAERFNMHLAADRGKWTSYHPSDRLPVNEAAYILLSFARKDFPDININDLYVRSIEKDGDTYFDINVSTTPDKNGKYTYRASNAYWFKGVVVRLPKQNIYSDSANMRQQQPKLESSKDFKINKTTLVKYKGKEVNVTIPNGITTIGQGAFQGSVVSSVTMLDSVTSIGRSAFNSCARLASVIIPNSVIIIGDWAFFACASLARITIPNSVTSIGENAFSDCTSLTSVAIGNGVTNIGEYAFSDCTSLTSVTIPNRVSIIGKCAFSNCTSITSVTIPDSVTSIRYGVFKDCTSLTNVIIPNSVTSIDYFAFGNCTSLASVTFQGTIQQANFSTNNAFPGDLRDKYFAGGRGTYTRTASSSTWTKQ